MAKGEKSRFWRRCRTLFRSCRITALVVVAVLLSALLYLNQVGLPGFIKDPLLEKLRARGLELQFSRLRWKPVQGVVAEHVRFGRATAEATDTPGPTCVAKEVQLR